MAKQDKAKSGEYLAESEIWYEEIYRNGLEAAKRWRTIAFVLAGICAVLAIGLAALIPLKEFRPYVITVDKDTGRATASYIAQSGPLTQDEAVVRSLIAQYVIARETYDLYDGQARFDNVAEQSVGQALVSYRDLWKSDNADYPVRIYGREGKVTIEVISISFLNDNTANVRYTKTFTVGGNNPVTDEYVAIVGYGFGPRETDLRGIIRNPLGFIVKSWRSDQIYKGN